MKEQNKRLLNIIEVSQNSTVLNKNNLRRVIMYFLHFLYF